MKNRSNNFLNWSWSCFKKCEINTNCTSWKYRKGHSSNRIIRFFRSRPTNAV
jgi:hypothetical protein